MSQFPTVSLPSGEIQFGGSVRGVDGYGHAVFEVTLPGAPTMYGEWDALFRDNGHNFIVEIVSFGYVTSGDLGNTDPGARRRFTKEEILVLEDLVRALFASVEARKNVPPFGTIGGVYEETVAFRPGWISNKTEAPSP